MTLTKPFTKYFAHLPLALRAEGRRAPDPLGAEIALGTRDVHFLIAKIRDAA